MQPNLSVLVVDPSEDTREVLQTALARHGVRVLEADAGQSASIAHDEQPNLIVVDLDSAVDPPAVLASFADRSKADDTPIVILGTARQKKSAHSGDFFTKPYHYAPLIRTIEERLERCQSTRAA